MTRYEELCDLYARARARGDARRERCAVVLERLRERIVAHLAMPEDAFAFRPAESEPESEASESLREALSVTDDGTWHVGVQIALRDPAQPQSPFLVFFDVRVREEDGRFAVLLTEDDPGQSVRPDDLPSLDEVAAGLHRRLAEWLREHLDEALGAAGRIERFGVYL